MDFLIYSDFYYSLHIFKAGTNHLYPYLKGTGLDSVFLPIMLFLLHYVL